MKRKLIEPKNLRLKIGSKDEAFWTEVKNSALISLEQAKNTVKLQEGVLAMAWEKIKLEQRKGKV